MNTHSTDISVAPRHQALGELMATLQDACRALAIRDADSLRLQLVAEELFINTIDHGGPHTAPVTIRLQRLSDGIALHYEDDGSAFDPTMGEASANPGDLPGGLGLRLLRGLARDMRYRREAGRNIVELTLGLVADQLP